MHGSNYGLKPLDDESVRFLDDLYDTLTAKRKFCSFCHGGNTCICGQCPELEYHDPDCLVALLDRITWNYRHPRQGDEPETLVLTTREQIEWHRTRITKLEEQLGIDSDE